MVRRPHQPVTPRYGPPTAPSNQPPGPPQGDPPQAGPPQGNPPPALAGTPPWGLECFCPVSLCEKQKWVRGDRRWGAIHRGRTYLFVGPEEQRRFLANPDRYAPVVSGNDVVLAVEQGQIVPGMRQHGVFYQGRVYLFSSEATLQKFSLNPGAYDANHSSEALRSVRQSRSAVAVATNTPPAWRQWRFKSPLRQMPNRSGEHCRRASGDSSKPQSRLVFSIKRPRRQRQSRNSAPIRLPSSNCVSAISACCIMLRGRRLSCS